MRDGGSAGIVVSWGAGKCWSGSSGRRLVWQVVWLGQVGKCGCELVGLRMMHLIPPRRDLPCQFFQLCVFQLCHLCVGARPISRRFLPMWASMCIQQPFSFPELSGATAQASPHAPGNQVHQRCSRCRPSIWHRSLPLTCPMEKVSTIKVPKSGGRKNSPREPGSSAPPARR